MTHTSSRTEPREAAQEARGTEIAPRRERGEKGPLALQEGERVAINEFLQSDSALHQTAKALAQQRHRARCAPNERPSAEDIFFHEGEAEAVLRALAEVIE